MRVQSWTFCIKLQIYNIIIEQHLCIEFCFKIGKNVTEDFESIELALKKVSLRRYVIFDWFKRFEEGGIFIEGDHCSGRPSTSKTNDIIERKNCVWNWKIDFWTTQIL